MSFEPPKFHGAKLLSDSFAPREHPDQDPEGVRAWRRERDERELADHPWRARFSHWAPVAVLAALGLGVVVYFLWYLIAYEP